MRGGEGKQRTSGKIRERKQEKLWKVIRGVRENRIGKQKIREGEVGEERKSKGEEVEEMVGNEERGNRGLWEIEEEDSGGIRENKGGDQAEHGEIKGGEVGKINGGEVDAKKVRECRESEKI